MALSPNYQWAEPDNSSLVKNGAQDIRALGDAIDTSLWNVGFGQAGKNKIINGDFGIWQRGTSFSTTVDMYLADRFYVQRNNTNTISQQTFTPGTAPVAGYESTFFLRYARTTVAGGADFLYQRIEDVRTFAGNPVTFSFWAKADTAITIGAVDIDQVFGTGGSGTVTITPSPTTLAVTTSWARYSYTVTLPSIAGKTIGTGSHIRPRINFTGTAATFDTWGWQIEYGSKATPFETATGTIQGELSACQRYYVRWGGDSTYQYFATMAADASTTTMLGSVFFPVKMRTSPTLSSAGSWMCYVGSSIKSTSSQIGSDAGGTLVYGINLVGMSGLTSGDAGNLRANNDLTAFLAFSAEL
jgi:hypothetical protein